MQKGRENWFAHGGITRSDEILKSFSDPGWVNSFKGKLSRFNKIIGYGFTCLELSTKIANFFPPNMITQNYIIWNEYPD